MAIGSGWDPDLLDPRWTSITMDAAKRPGVFEQLVQIKDGSNRQMFPLPDRVKTAEVGTLGPMAETEQHAQFYSDDPVKGYSKETVHKKLSIKVTFTEEALDDDLFGITDQYAQQLGNSDKLTRELDVAQVYDNLFNTTYYTAPDGLAIASTSHTSKANALLRANCLTDSSALTYSGVQDLLLVASRQTDMRGYPMPELIADEVLVVYQPEDEWAYTTLFSDRSQYEVGPGVFTNNPNVLLGGPRRYRGVRNFYQTGTGTKANRLWALMDPTDIPIWMVNRWPLKTHTWTLNGNLSIAYSARCRRSIHIRRQFGIYASGN